MPAQNGQTSVVQRVNASFDLGAAQDELMAVLSAIQADLAQLAFSINNHTHSGITAGGGTSGTANAATIPATPASQATLAGLWTQP